MWEMKMEKNLTGNFLAAECIRERVACVKSETIITQARVCTSVHVCVRM